MSILCILDFYGPDTFCPNTFCQLKFGLQTYGLQAFGLQTYGLQAFGLQTFCLQTFGPQTFGLQTFSQQIFGLHTYDLQTLCIKTFGYSMEVLYKDPAIWFDRARLANTCIPPSFKVSKPMQLHDMRTDKNKFVTIKIAKLGEIIFYKKQKTEREFDRLSFGNNEFFEQKNQQSKKFDKPSTYIYFDTEIEK
jgi:hypothetical protein